VDPGTAFEECVATGEAAENEYGPMDVIFLVDNSPSMRDEILWTRQNLNAFSQTIAARGLSARVVMVSCSPGNCDMAQFWGICIDPPLGKIGGCPDGGPADDTNLPGYLHVDERMPSHKKLQWAINTYPSWRDSIRPIAQTHFVVISDDTDEQTPEWFTQQLAAQQPPIADFVFHGIFSFLSKEAACAISSGEPCCTFAAPTGEGVPYRQLVAQTGGIAGDLCAQDFTPIFAQFATAVIRSAKLSCSWAIPAPPPGQILDPRLINVEFTDASGQKLLLGYSPDAATCARTQSAWYYDNPAAPSRVIACPDTCSAIRAETGAQMYISFGCKTVVAEPVY
jgi:hypothetical protein